MIKAITVRLYYPVAATPPVYDEFGEPVTTESYADVPGVLVYPAANDAIVTDLQIYGKRTMYELCIPKGDTNVWEDRDVEFFGKRFHVFSPEIEYIDANVPLRWNKKVKVERIV